ncbi:hypothetical protein CFOL_v3_02854 [Cephalotus follicularis]|uniref:Uncharacterized protein n=1 Tax=Cephalotus follicularis TaxID=3775 RepID=A0A1Q3AUU1_CEPFO|nr:hypothetical protein CFOL_v3_02854 [Cephalotus follicularis]
MGKWYNDHLHHPSLHLHDKSTFLPMLCSRPSLKDVALPKSASFSGVDPLSPKIGCMGQVKRSNKIVGFPAATSQKLTITTRSNNDVKYLKLKKLFSSKNLTGTNNTTSVTAYRIKRGNINGTSEYKNGCKSVKSCASTVSIVDMDPPLPVIKKLHKPSDGGEGNNLYKRRSGGVPLRGLKLQNVQINRHQFELCTV